MTSTLNEFTNMLINMGFTAVYKQDFDILEKHGAHEARVYSSKQNGNDVTSVILVGDNNCDDVTFTFINGKAVQRVTFDSANHG